MRLALLLLVLLLPAAAHAAVEQGDRAPAIEGPGLDGKTLRLADWRGQVVYVDFWASWCGPCQVALPVLQRLQERWQRKGLRVLTVNVDERRGDAERMLMRLKLKLPVVLDPKGQWAERYDLPGMPSGYLISRQGRVLHVFAGYRNEELPQLEARIAQALEKKL